MKLLEILKELAVHGVNTELFYNQEKEQFMLDLKTAAKSHLYLHENGMLEGRYNYQKQIDFTQELDDIILELCNEFSYALHGRSYCQHQWSELCNKKGVKIETYI